MGLRDLVFFLTGAAALGYEVLWGRLLVRLLGGDAEGAAWILALFLGGLGLGAYAFGGRAARTLRPRAWFAGLELFAALCAVLSPHALALVDPLAGLGARLFGAALVILPPTLAMGATFPLMGRLSITERSAAGPAISGFYGANTLGACLGALLAPLVWMRVFGLSGGLAACATLDVLAAGLVLLVPLPPASAAASEQARALPDPARERFGLPRALFVTTCLGAASLALEVLLTRLLVNVTGATTYAFAIVLSVFLLGLGLGARQSAARLADPRAARRLLVACAAFAPALTLAGLLLLRWQLGESDLFGVLRNRQPGGAGTWRLWASHATFAALALLPVTLAFGMALPAVCALALEHAPRSPSEGVLGRVYLWNSAGALAGSLAAGFVLLPLLGPRPGVALALVPCLLALLALHAVREPRTLFALGLALGLGVLALRAADDPARPDRLALLPGRNATVSVEESTEGDGARVRSLRVNGKVEATTAPVDMRLQRLLGHIPGLLHGEVESALVIGMGTGMTAGSLLDLPTLERLTIFEIEGRMPEAARLFSDWNGALLDDPRLEVRITDGRLALERSTRRFDLITADPLHPATRGSSDLFSLEHFESMAAHLAPGGVASQWLPLYELSQADVETVIATWTAAFPHTSAWITAYDLALVGSLEPPANDLGALPWPARVGEHLSEVGVHGPLELAALWVGGDADLRALAAGATLTTLERPLLELRAPFSYLAGYTVPILAWAARAEPVERLPEAARPRAREVRDLLEAFLEALPQGWSAAAGTYGRALLALPDASN